MRNKESIFRVISAAAPFLLNCLGASSVSADQGTLDGQLSHVLKAANFFGNIGNTLERRLGRKVNQDLADLGLLLFFDVSGGLHLDNTCAGRGRSPLACRTTE